MKLLDVGDTGCYADGSLGHDHIRSVLARILRQYIRTLPLGGQRAARDICAALKGEMTDDASEEQDALELLNTYATTSNVVFEMIDGDLMLITTDSEECK